jgi:hypothetical protein
MEQQALGENHVGTDGVTVGMSWTWENGWTARTGYRLSGQDEWRTCTYPGRDAAEAHALISDFLAAALGLV